MNPGCSWSLCHIWRQCLSRNSGWDRVLQCSLQGRALWYCFSKFLQPNYQCFSWSPFTLSAPTALPICSSCLPIRCSKKTLKPRQGSP
ncbi:hypothetical protein PAHAL_4G326700 [Panicum hallii]|uniref:Uncharacterized protein n=1 Tax=Panicum hallii TaxID=206008 RepID=A0A2T8JER8_9POAL|nr:hypothetical protein PAHAL_4G326700 [Panicum hallii]